MSSTLSFSFSPSSLPAYAQQEFLARFVQLVADYGVLTAPVPPSPSADALPPPTSFVPVAGDDAPVVAPAKKARKNPWADLTPEQKAERLAAMKRGRATKMADRRPSADSLEQPAAAVTTNLVTTEAPAPPVIPKALEDMSGQELRDCLAELTGKPKGRSTSSGFGTKVDLIAEIRRLRNLADSASDNASETSSKKARKNPWADLTPEQKATKIAAMKAGRDAKKAAALAGTSNASA